MGEQETNQEATDAALSDEREPIDKPDTHGENKTDTGLADERETREFNRAGQRADTDSALAGERGYTDKLERSEQTLADWRAEHAEDDLVEVKKVRREVGLPGWLNFAMIVLVIAWMAVVTSQVIVSTGRISEINQRQIQAVRQQNNQQLCVQADMVGAIKKIGLKLGLPVDDIVPPDVTGLGC